MTALLGASVLDRALESLGEALPRLAGAILLLVAGLAAAWIAGRVVARLLRTLAVDDLAERYGVHDVLARVGFERSLSRLIARAVRLTLVVVVIVASLSLLGLAALTASLNAAVLFLPRLFVAVALILVGFVVADFVGDRIDRLADQMALGVPLGAVARVLVLALVTLTALAQLGVPTAMLSALVAIVIIAGALTLTLAFGLGSREVARELSAGRYVGASFEVGQVISVDRIRGEIVAFDTAATVVRTEAGETVRLPNHVLLESVVTVHGPGGSAAGR